MAFSFISTDIAGAGSFPGRSDRHTVLAGGVPVTVYTFQPAGCAGGDILLLLAGYERNARDYRRSARALATRACLTVVAPELDQERFPRAIYQRAGIVPGDDETATRNCISPVIADIIAWSRRRMTRASASTVLFGHSAGAQLLSRLTAYCPLPEPRRIVIANPSSHVWPDMTEAAPFGFGQLTGHLGAPAALAAYLAQPITIYLGTSDTENDRLDQSRRAMRQGINRYERGRNVFTAAQKVARDRGLPFNWRLVEARGIGHDHKGMLGAPDALEAIAGSL
ncbi:MAG: hypothetical protein NW217_15960 [Hyphomicrobiaceae bacterium]|nr:hypothetical protein [Hyphomicrobiaceae bacterium]